jgi:hypothetical protein
MPCERRARHGFVSAKSLRERTFKRFGASLGRDDSGGYLPPVIATGRSVGIEGNRELGESSQRIVAAPSAALSGTRTEPSQSIPQQRPRSSYRTFRSLPV